MEQLKLTDTVETAETAQYIVRNWVQNSTVSTSDILITSCVCSILQEYLRLQII